MEHPNGGGEVTPAPAPAPSKLEKIEALKDKINDKIAGAAGGACIDRACIMGCAAPHASR